MAKGQKGCINKDCEVWAGGEKKRFFNDSYKCCPQCGQPLKYVCRRCGMELPDNSKRFCERCEYEIKDEKERKIETFTKNIKKGATKAAQFVGEKSKDISEGIGEGAKKAGEFVSDAASEVADKISELADKIKESPKKDEKSEIEKILEEAKKTPYKSREEYLERFIYTDDDNLRPSTKNGQPIIDGITEFDESKKGE